MERITTILTNTTWTAPAGVTEIMVTPSEATGVPYTCAKLLSVTPNTSYSIVMISATYTINNPNTFGSLFSWTGASRLRISWVE